MRHLVFLLMTAVLFVHCKEITTTTRVHADGSCDRTVVVQSSSKNPSGSAFPIPRDSSWSITVTPDSTDSSRYAYTARKSFKTVEALNEKESPLQVQRQVSLQRRFRWFSTDLTYHEQYKAYSPFHLIPISNYLSDAELKEWQAAPDSIKTFDKKMDAWVMDNLLEIFYRKLYRAADSLQQKDVVQALPLHKTALLKALQDNDQETDGKAVIKTCEQVLGVQSLSALQASADSILAGLNPIIEFTGEVESNEYTNVVIMPGVVIAGNAATLLGREARWTLKAKQFYLQDYHMWVTSRVQHRWALVVTIGLALILAAALILPPALRYWHSLQRRT